MSEEALTWAQTQRAKNRSAKFVLMRLAAYADAKGVAWALVPLLAQQIDGDDRTVQRALRALEAARLIVKTGRFYSRNVPYYRLDMDGSARAELASATVTSEAPNGDNLSPLADVATVTSEPSNGDTGATQKKITQPSGGSNEPPSGRARAIGSEACRAAFAAYPEAGRKGVSSWRLWSEAWASEVAGGADELRLARASDAYGRCKSAWGSSGRPKAAHRFLATGAWEAFGDAPAAAAKPRWSGPETVREQLVERRGEDFASAWLDPGSWSGKAVVARTRIAAERLREALRGSSIEVVDPAVGGQGAGRG